MHVIVKMNPPMLGQDKLEHLLYDVMGYNEHSSESQGVFVGPAVR